MKLEYLMTYHADLKPPVDVGAGPHGRRVVFDVTGGTFEGPRLRGTLLESGGDWLLTRADGVSQLDVRATFRTDDGALLYLTYRGISIPSEKAAAKRAAGQPTDYGDAYFMTSPVIETGDPRYAWLNTIVCVGEGRGGPGWVEYRVYQVVND